MGIRLLSSNTDAAGSAQSTRGAGNNLFLVILMSNDSRISQSRGAPPLPPNRAAQVACLVAVITAIAAFAAAPHAGKGSGTPALVGCAFATGLAFVLMVGSIFINRTERRTLVLAFVFIMLAVAGILRIATLERDSINLIPCASHLNQLGLGIYLYARDHDGRFPASLEEVVLAQGLAPELLVCPSSADTIASAKSMPLAQELKHPGHCSYIYLGAGRNMSDFAYQWVLAYDRPANHPEGYFVLFGDGHVEFQRASDFEKRLEETRQQLLAATQPATQASH
jgi:prepilin-type processing-associated H-X9-DG protein